MYLQTFHEIILKELHILLYMKDLHEDDLEMDEDESMAAKAALKYVIKSSNNIPRAILVLIGAIFR